jgi:Tol biopolymer transport system component/C-terminal processing protease CtpA/Prc
MIARSFHLNRSLRAFFFQDRTSNPLEQSINPMRSITYRLLLIAAVLTVRPRHLIAQLAAPVPQPIVGARVPALSPDGKRLAFVYRGDVWIAPSEGGHAVPLAQHLEADSFPIFSPDAKWVIFSSKRFGDWDLFAIPADGGTTRRLTWHSGSEIATGWSPDGKQVLFAGQRDSANYAVFALDLKTLETQKLCEDYASLTYPNYSPDGKLVAYARYGFHWTRPRYVGSAAAQIWILNPADGSRHALTTNDHQHLWPKFLPDGKHIVTVTFSDPTPTIGNVNEALPKFTDSPARTPNLWVYDLNGSARQLTTFTGNGGVRWPSVATKSGDIAFEYGTDLWLLKDGKKKASAIKLLVAVDEKQNGHRNEKLSDGVTEAEPSPDGKHIAFGLQGDIWSIAVDKPKGVSGRNAVFARRLTDWPGDDSDFSWSKDGKKLFFTSDRDNNTRLYEMNVSTLAVKSLWNRDEDVSLPKVSPDGQQLAFWVSGPNGGLYAITLTNGVTKRILEVPGTQSGGSGGGDYEWSPDMRWIAFAKKSESRSMNIWVAPADGGPADGSGVMNVTHLNANHSQPAWSPDGKYLFFQSDRDGAGLYALPLTREAARASDTDLKFEKPNDPIKVEIDFTDTSRRIRKISSQNPDSDLMVTPDGTILFLSDGDVWSVTYDGKETKRLTNGGGKQALRLMKDGKKASYMQNGEIYTVKVDGSNSTKVEFTAEWDRDVRAERQASFAQFWRGYHRNFYDPNFHGRDWLAIRKRYEPMLDAIETQDEFATVLQMMVGELEASHSEVKAHGNATPEPVTPSLGFTFDYSYHGKGIKVAEVPAGSPASFEKTRIKPGDYVLSINGHDISLNENLYEYLNDKNDREFEFLVNDQPDKENARKVMYKALSPNEWTELNNRNRIENHRKYVEQKTDGKVGYLYLAAMGQNNQVQFEREAYEYMGGKSAMVIDVRFNRGGNISDTLIDWLERKQHGWYRGRDEKAQASPARAWDKPVIVLMNEHSYSNGEMFPDAMRQHGLAKLVGMPTPGYVIWTGDFRLVDGTGARMPGGGVYRLDGSPMENHGEVPDVTVPFSPEDWLANRDPQIDKAIEMLRQPKDQPGD